LGTGHCLFLLDPLVVLDLAIVSRWLSDGDSGQIIVTQIARHPRVLLARQIPSYPSNMVKSALVSSLATCRIRWSHR